MYMYIYYKFSLLLCICVFLRVQVRGQPWIEHSSLEMFIHIAWSSQSILGTVMSPPPQGWDYRHALTTPSILPGCWGAYPHVVQQVLHRLDHLSTDHIFFCPYQRIPQMILHLDYYGLSCSKCHPHRSSAVSV